MTIVIGFSYCPYLFIIFMAIFILLVMYYLLLNYFSTCPFRATILLLLNYAVWLLRGDILSHVREIINLRAGHNYFTHVTYYFAHVTYYFAYATYYFAHVTYYFAHVTYYFAHVTYYFAHATYYFAGGREIKLFFNLSFQGHSN